MDDKSGTGAFSEAGESSGERLFGEELSGTSEEDSGEPTDNSHSLWSRLPKQGVAGLVGRLLLYGGVATIAYFIFGSVVQGLMAVLAGISAEAGHFALLGYLSTPRRRKLPDRIDAHELLGVKAPEDLAEKRRGGARGRINRARAMSITFGALGTVLTLAPLGVLGSGLGPQQLPLPEVVTGSLGQVANAALVAFVGFAGGFWPNAEKERVKELLQEE